MTIARIRGFLMENGTTSCQTSTKDTHLVCMLDAVLSVETAASNLRVHRNAVVRWWDRYHTESEAKRRRDSGRLRLTSRDRERRL